MVEAKVEKLSNTKKKITVDVPQETVKNHLNKAYNKVSKKAKIKGFRAGKVPHNVLEQYYGSDIQIECVNTLVDETFPTVLKNEELFPVTRPNFNIGPMNKDEAYQYSVEVEVKPDFELKDYKGMKLKKEDAKVSDEEIQKELENIQNNVANLKPVEDKDAALKEGLVAVIDFEGKVNGEIFEGGTAKDYTLEYGRGMFLQDFEDQMKDMKVGEDRVVKITFPEDYFQKDLANQKAEFSVTLKGLKEKDLPAIDDELAKDVGKKDLAELKSEIEALILQNKNNQMRQGLVEQIREKILKDYKKLDIPEGLLKEQIERSGQKEEEVLSQLRFEFVMEAVAKAENIESKPEDVDQRLQMYSQLYRKPLEEIRKIFLTQQMLPGLISGILIDKALDFVIENAK